ncbi:MAG: hypothetical protein VYD87_05090 [Pseudomonadota bacterium]|nr:hypothetical protein [Pseudomonadota bacterium]
MRLEIALGDMGAEAVAAARGGPPPFPFRDEPSVGPLSAPTAPGFAPMRARFWAETLGFMADAGAPDPEAALPGHYAALSSAIAGAGEVAFWLAGSAQEAVALALVEALAEAAGAALFVMPCGAAEEEGRGVAERPPPVLAAAEAMALGPEARARLAAFRAALLAPEAAPLREEAARAPAPGDPLACLRAAAASRLARLPDPTRGLGADEARMIDALGPDWTLAAAALGRALRAPGPDRLGDLWLWRLTREMADPALGAPLIALRGDPARPRAAEARLTGFGRAVQAGETSRLARAGLVRDLGGLRLRHPPPAE